jgi:RsiW-degrading membrane proteinase PrsW (M82 family)
MNASKNPRPGSPESRLSKSTIIPLLGDRTDLVRKGYLIPAGITAAATALMSYGLSISVTFTVWIFGIYTMLVTNWAFYQICGRRKPWWVIASVGAFTCAMVLWPYLIWKWIYEVFEVFARYADDKYGIVPQFFGYFLGVGLREELLKAIPLVVLALVYLKWKDPLAKLVGLSEPLDGILMGIASGAGFTLAESIDYYLPKVAHEANPTIAITLMLPRILSSFSSHMAWSGYLGYFIGLAVLKLGSNPESLDVRYTCAKILTIGWFSAAFLHGFFDTFGAGNPLSLGLVTLVLSYGCLAAAILKARQISPTRAENFATVIAPAVQTSPARSGSAIRESPRSTPRPSTTSAAAPVRAQRLMLEIRGAHFPLKTGTPIEYQALGSAGAARGPGTLAAVEASPTDANVLGLRNTSNTAWLAILPGGKNIEVEKGRVLRLAPGVTIDFGGVEGRVQSGG